MGILGDVTSVEASSCDLLAMHRSFIPTASCPRSWPFSDMLTKSTESFWLTESAEESPETSFGRARDNPLPHIHSCGIQRRPQGNSVYGAKL